MSGCLRGAGVRQSMKDDILSVFLGALTHCHFSTAVLEKMSVFEMPICLQLLSSFNWCNPVRGA